MPKYDPLFLRRLQNHKASVNGSKNGINYDGVILDEKTVGLAIRQACGCAYEDGRKLAEYLFNFFGYEDRILDNVLEAEERDAFYILEDAKIMETEREENTLIVRIIDVGPGHTWRTHYWVWNKPEILRLAELAKMKEGHIDAKKYDEFASMYGDVPDKIWERGSEGVASGEGELSA